METKIYTRTVNLVTKTMKNKWGFYCTKRMSTVGNSLKTLKDMPGLSSWPIIGPLHHFLPVIGTIGMNRSVYNVYKTLHEKFGPMCKLENVFSRSTMVIIFEPNLFEQVFRAQEENPSRPGFETLEYYRTVLKASYYQNVYGLMTAQGDQWRDFRTKVNPVLLKIPLVKLYRPTLEEISDDMIMRLEKINKGDPNYLKDNINIEFSKFALESVAAVSLGLRIGCLQDDIPDNAKQLMECAKNIMDLAFVLEFMPNPWKIISTPGYKKIINCYDLQWKISTAYIKDARNKIKTREFTIPDDQKSIVEKLLDIDEKIAIMMVNEMLLGGIDTVSNTLIGLLYYLATNPNKQENLRNEITSGGTNKRYLKACLKESLRLRPIIAANLRRTTANREVGGYLIPKGIDVISPNEYLSRTEKYYKRPMEFIPERWLAEKNDPYYYGNAHPMVTIPFGYGIRSCIGRRIAELEIEIFMSKLIQNFNVSWNGPPIKIVERVIKSYKKPFGFELQKL